MSEASSSPLADPAIPAESTASVEPLPYPSPDGRELPPATVIGGRYEVLSFLGRGGSGFTYRAIDRELGCEVALKVLRPERATPEGIERLRREVRIGRNAKSPHLLRLFDIGSTAQETYLTMELAGESLRARLSRGLLEITESLRIACGLFEALAALHLDRLVHRDVKPENILFMADGLVKLGDFGLALDPRAGDHRLTRLGQIVGTPGYLSPEQTLGQDASPRSDLYAAGVVLFEMITGRLPQEMSSEIGRRLGPLQSAPDVRRYRPETPRWLAHVVARLLKVRPRDRYTSAEAVLEDLKNRRSPRRSHLRQKLLRAAFIILLFLPPTILLVTRIPKASFSHLVPLGENGIAAVDAKGEILWRIRGVAPETADRSALARITPNGPRLIAIVLARPWASRIEELSTLSFLDPASGRVIKRVKLATGEGLFPNDPPRFDPFSIKALSLSRDGVDDLLVSYRHIPEAPSYVVLYSPRADRSKVVFYARGSQGFQGVTDLDRNGSPDFLFAGVNNGWNWVNTVAAVRLDPWPWTERTWMSSPVTTPDLVDNGEQERDLLWYATIPRGHLEGPDCLSIDQASRKITVHYRSGKIWNLGFDGFPPETVSPKNSPVRELSRREAYGHLREAERLRRAGAFVLSMSEARAAVRSADQAHETWLGQYAERLEAKLLVVEGRITEAEALFLSLTERAEDAPEVSYDAAVAFHLHGDLRRAVAWYERGLGRGATMDAGTSKHEFLKGEVLALVEQKHYTEALTAVDRFGTTYPTWQTSLWLFREYVRWRAGERPEINPSGVHPFATDLSRYWVLEFELAAGGSPWKILPQVDSFLAERPETKAEVLSLRAEILARMGRGQEAAEVMRSALELVRVERSRDIVARAHADLLARRARELRALLIAP
jgi:tetratricopeptide (TPR) repeat protein